MKYATINERGDVRRISVTEPQYTPNDTTFVQMSDEDAALVQAGREVYPKKHYRWVNNKLMTLRDAIIREELLAMPIEELRSVKLVELKEARDADYKSVLVTSDGLHFKADLETILDVKSLAELLADGESYPNYKNADGTFNTITKEQFQAAFVEGAARKTAAFAKWKSLVDQVDAATSYADIQAIQY